MGGVYMPLDTLIRQLAKKIKRDGKRIRGIVDSLLKKGYLIPHKGGNAVSLNPSKKGEIVREIEEFLSH